jgi:hypothetical protein
MATTGGGADRDRSHGDEPRTPSGRPAKSARRARILIFALIILAILAIFAFILLVSQAGTDDDSDIYGQHGSAAAVLVTDGAVPVRA